jgi:hypothetical protein
MIVRKCADEGRELIFSTLSSAANWLPHPSFSSEEEARLMPPPLAMMVMAARKMTAVLPGLGTMPGRVAILAVRKASRYSLS